jgi:hypothetical protein
MDLKKRLPLTYLAILNGHGDYGLSNERAFMPSPVLTINERDATVTFPDLPRSTTRVTLHGSALKKPIDRAVTWSCDNEPQVNEIDKDAAPHVQFIEAYDDQDALLALGIPVRLTPTDAAPYSTGSGSQAGF